MGGIIGLVTRAMYSRPAEGNPVGEAKVGF